MLRYSDRCQDGYIAAILADEGTKDIPVGTPMAVMVDDKVRLSMLKVRLTRLHSNTLWSETRQDDNIPQSEVSRLVETTALPGSLGLPSNRACSNLVAAMHRGISTSQSCLGLSYL
jgi:hypothetical protein